MNRARVLPILVAVSTIGIFVFIAMRFNQTRDARDFQLDPTHTPAITQLISEDTNPSTSKQENQVNIYMVALEDNGKSGVKIGCNDSLVSVIKEVSSEGDRIQNTLELLFSVKDQYYGESGLYNSLYQSDLTVDEIIDSSTNITVRILGDMKLGGTCDSPRFQEQIEQTVQQFVDGKTVVIYINNLPLAQVLSQQ